MLNKNLIIKIICILVLSSFTKGYCDSIKGDEYFAQNNFVSAIDYYKKQIKKDSQNAYWYSQYCGAESYLYEKDESVNLNETIKLCDKAISLDEKSADTYFYRGRIHQFLNSYGLAIEDYSKAIQLNSNYLKAYNNRAFLYMAKNEQQNANEDYNKIINYNSNNMSPDDYYLKGNAKIEVKDYLGAIFDLNKAINLSNQKEVKYYILLAKAQGLEKDYDGLIETCTEGLKYHNDNEKLYLYRGSALGSKEILRELSDKNKAHNFEKAFADLRMAKKLALANNNQETYKESIKMQKFLEEQTIKIKTESQNISVNFNFPSSEKVNIQNMKSKGTQPISIVVDNNLMNKYKEISSDEKIIKALEILKNAKCDNNFSYNAIMGNNLSKKPMIIEFYDLSSINETYKNYDGMGYMKNNNIYIYINNKHRNANPAAIAALIAGRCVHQDAKDSLAEEIYSWTLEAAIWKEFYETYLISGSDELLKREESLRIMLEEGNNTNKCIKKYILQSPAYKGFPTYSPGFNYL